MGGFIQIRRGLWDHIAEGKMTLFELGVYLHLQRCANFKTGIQRNSARHIAFATGSTAGDRTIQKALANLDGVYIKRFRIPGKKGDYPILIHKFEITDGPLKGSRLNALETKDWRKPVYFPSGDEGTDVSAEAYATPGDTLGGSSGSTSGGTLGEYVNKYRNNSENNSGNKSGNNFGNKSEKNSNTNSQAVEPQGKQDNEISIESISIEEVIENG